MKTTDIKKQILDQVDNQINMKTIPIEIGCITLVYYIIKEYPSSGGNCFSLLDTDGSEHKIVNFKYENLEEWIRQTKQTDITVRCIPKSDKLWEICDERIPKNWYADEYCTICTPIRMIPFEQRKQYLKNKKFRKTEGLSDIPAMLFESRTLKPSGQTPPNNYNFIEGDPIIYFNGIKVD